MTASKTPLTDAAAIVLIRDDQHRLGVQWESAVDGEFANKLERGLSARDATIADYSSRLKNIEKQANEELGISRATIAELTRERDAAIKRKQHHIHVQLDMEALCLKAEAERDALSAENAELRASLLKYGQHHISCPASFIRRGFHPCDCGLADIRATLNPPTTLPQPKLQQSR